MTAIDLHKYINENNIEWHWASNEGTDDVLIFPYTFQLEEFGKLIKASVADDPLMIALRDGYIGIWMLELCEYYGIDINEVFPKERQP